MHQGIAGPQGISKCSAFCIACCGAPIVVVTTLSHRRAIHSIVHCICSLHGGNFYISCMHISCCVTNPYPRLTTAAAATGALSIMVLLPGSGAEVACP
jgi:hypothetical protein